MSEILKYEGKLQRKKLEAEKLKLRMKGLVSSIRDLLDPTDPVETLKTDIVAEQALELAALRIEHNSLQNEISEINRILGR